MIPLGIESVGIFTSVGVNAAQTVGSLRTNLQRFAELTVQLESGKTVEIITPDDEPLIGASSPIPPDQGAGVERIIKMGAYALKEATPEPDPVPVPLFWCAPQPDQLTVDGPSLLRGVAEAAQIELDLEQSAILCEGRAGVVSALARAGQLLAQNAAPACYVGGSDSYLHADRLDSLIRANRVVWSDNINGFIPGEGAAVLRLSARPKKDPMAIVCGLGAGRERAVQEMGNKVNGRALTQAARDALADAALTIDQIGVVAHDAAGEHIFAKELALALARLAPDHGPDGELAEPSYQVLAPPLCLGELGAAIGPVALAYLAFGLDAEQIAGPGAMLMSMADNGARGAAVMTRATPQARGERGHA